MNRFHALPALREAVVARFARPRSRPISPSGALLCLALSALGAGCERAERPSATPATDTPAEATTTAASAVDTLAVVRPTVLAYFAATQAEIDESPEIGEALADFQFYLMGARDSLEKRGVLVHALYADSIAVRLDSTTQLFLPRQQRSAVGYVIYAPGRSPELLDGVVADSALLGAVDEYLRR